MHYYRAAHGVNSGHVGQNVAVSDLYALGQSSGPARVADGVEVLRFGRLRFWKRLLLVNPETDIAAVAIISLSGKGVIYR